MGSSPMGLDSDQRDEVMEFVGTLKKWTNYILGWQSRFFVLRHGNLLYYKSENDVRFGCRGAINLSNASLVAHEFDECRFDIHIYDLIWYLRSESPEERRKWVEALTMHTKTPKTVQTLLCPSEFSLTLREKLQDVKTLRDVLSEQSEKLCQNLTTLQNLERITGFGTSFVQNPTEMRSELINLKATISELLSTMYTCVDMVDARGKFLIFGRENSNSSVISVSSDSPEMVEGRHCLLRDEEFFDAVESSLEKIEEEAEMKKKLESRSFERQSINGGADVRHPLWSRILKKTEEQINIVTAGLDTTSWLLLLEDANMRMYSREVEIDGLVTDPLVAVYTVKGVTGREICHYFFGPQYRQDWEPTVERMEVVEKIGENVIVFYQVYKRVWPTAQRDTLFWSRLVHQTNPGAHDVWAVVNDSVELPQIPANDGKLVRVTFTACLYCVTETAGSPPYARDDVTCHLTYSTVVNPGGWVPASAVRALRRKEYPKFLTKFTSYVVEKTANLAMMM